MALNQSFSMFCGFRDPCKNVMNFMNLRTRKMQRKCTHSWLGVLWTFWSWGFHVLDASCWPCIRQKFHYPNFQNRLSEVECTKNSTLESESLEQKVIGKPSGAFTSTMKKPGPPDNGRLARVTQPLRVRMQMCELLSLSRVLMCASEPPVGSNLVSGQTVGLDCHELGHLDWIWA